MSLYLFKNKIKEEQIGTKRTFEPLPKFTSSYKKECMIFHMTFESSLGIFSSTFQKLGENIFKTIIADENHFSLRFLHTQCKEQQDFHLFVLSVKINILRKLF